MFRTLFVTVVLAGVICESAQAAFLEVEYPFDPRGALYSIRAGIVLKSGYTMGGEAISIPSPLTSRPTNHLWAAYEFAHKPAEVSHGVWLGAMLGNSSYAAGTGVNVRISPELGESVGEEISMFFHMLKTNNPGGTTPALDWTAISSAPASVRFDNRIGTESRILHIGDRFTFSLNAQANPGFDPSQPRVGADLSFHVSFDLTPPPPPVAMPPVPEPSAIVLGVVAIVSVLPVSVRRMATRPGRKASPHKFPAAPRRRAVASTRSGS